MRTRLLPVSFAFLMTACGNIGLGEDLDPLADPPDPPGTPDTGPTGGTPDAGPSSGACTPREVQAPAAWPFPRTKAAYLAEFGNVPGGRATCGAATVCHGDDTNAPFIPPTDDLLDDGATLAKAIDAIWASTVPKMFAAANNGPASPGPVSPVVWKHVTGKGNQALPYSAAAATFFEAYAKRALDCGYKPLVGAEPDPTADPDLCPLPVDLSYCNL